MKKMTFVKGTALTLACLGMLAPKQIMAAGPATAQAAGVTQIADVALTNGTLSGKLVDEQGQLLGGGIVKVSSGGREVASTVTTENGEFAIHNLKTGVYQVTAGQASGTVRLWDRSAAPPSAQNGVLLVDGEVTSRAQFGAAGGGLVIISAAVIASLIISAITLDRVNDIEDKMFVSP